MDTITKRWIKTAADEQAARDGCYFDESKANHVAEFFRIFLRHSKAPFAGKPFELSTWQFNELIGPAFGWMNANGTRRFRRVYCEVPKKNGKSTVCAGVALYLLVADGEAGAEVYSAASDRNQASIVFNEAMQMVQVSEHLHEFLYIKDSKKTIEFYNPETRITSIYKAISADATRNEGYNIHGLIFDELHTQPNRKLFDALRYGGAARRQPLTFMITTAGEDLTSLCWEQHVYAERVMNGEVRDDGLHAVIYNATTEDDPFAESTWRKANPSYGETISIEAMKEDAQIAKSDPLALASFLRYRLNIWGISDVRWMEPSTWDKCINLHVPKPRPGDSCYIGLDLSSTTDISAMCAFFPDSLFLMYDFWAPARALEFRSKKKRVSYDHWVKRGLVNLAQGEVIDYNIIGERLRTFAETYQVIQIAIDPNNATQFALGLREEGHEVEFVRQSFNELSAPMKRLQELVLQGKLVHHGNEVMRWMIGNVVAELNANNDIRPNKKKSKEVIDGVSATVMAIRQWVIAEIIESAYGTRGFMTT